VASARSRRDARATWPAFDLGARPRWVDPEPAGRPRHKVPLSRSVYLTAWRCSDRICQVSEGSRNDFGLSGNFVPFEGGAQVRSRGYLPHWEADHATYFVTVRLGDSLPDYVLSDLRSTYGDQALIHLEKYLDEGHGECILRDARCAEIVEKAILYFDEKRYRLYAHCVMPNHAHAIFQPFVGEGLSKVLHSWKSFTAKEINKTLERNGQVWQDEYFDHIIRSEKQLHNLILYVAANPRNAGLKNWKWVRPKIEDL